MNSDNYEFSKATMPQSTSAYSAYTDKQWNYINDINSGVYSNNSGLSLVTWDLTSIYNSAGFSDASDLYLAIPIVMCAACSSATQTVAAYNQIQTSILTPPPFQTFMQHENQQTGHSYLVR